MNKDDLLTIIKVTLPNVNDFNLIHKFGLIPWLIVNIAKTGGLLLIVWFLVKKIGISFSIGKSEDKESIKNTKKNRNHKRKARNKKIFR